MDKDVLEILKKLNNAGFEAAIVGGAVRDILAKSDVKDWDLTTSAKPEEILKLFPNSFYNNRFGTVGIKVGDQIVEVTTYRKEQKYSDGRHPDVVVWGKSLEEDLARRDFTINAIALKYADSKSLVSLRNRSWKITSGEKKSPQLPTLSSQFSLIDPYGGQADLEKKLIRTVGNPDARFSEDALRILRAVRLAATLGFEIEEKTKKSIIKNAKLLKIISGERIRVEIIKVIDSNNPADGIYLCRDLGILKEILPELDVCFKVEQKSPKRHHIFDVGTHCTEALGNCPSKKTIVRFATLLHDIGKAKVAAITEEGVRTFYNHEVVGGRQVLDIARRLSLSKADREKLYKLVRWHQFSVNEEQTDKALRRFIKNVGLENIEDMMDLRIGDRLGGGLQQPESWRLKLFRKRIKDELIKPFTVADLKVSGRDVMEILKIKPGPKVGEVLNKLFEEVEEDDKKNTRDYLLEKIKSFK